jgi:Putative Actinobacterial Holin-X, holin superfamily III
MESVADGSRPAAVPEPSPGDLVKQLSEQVSVLVRDELKLAQLEMRRKGKQAGLGIGMLGGGGLIALYGAGCLVACAVIAVSEVVAAWLAALIVGAALLAAGATAALVGKGRLQKAVPPVPKEAMDGVRTDVEVVKEGVRR